MSPIPKRYCYPRQASRPKQITMCKVRTLVHTCGHITTATLSTCLGRYRKGRDQVQRCKAGVSLFLNLSNDCGDCQRGKHVKVMQRIVHRASDKIDYLQEQLEASEPEAPDWLHIQEALSKARAAVPVINGWSTRNLTRWQVEFPSRKKAERSNVCGCIAKRGSLLRYEVSAGDGEGEEQNCKRRRLS